MKTSMPFSLHPYTSEWQSVVVSYLQSRPQVAEVHVLEHGQPRLLLDGDPDQTNLLMSTQRSRAGKFAGNIQDSYDVRVLQLESYFSFVNEVLLVLRH